MKSTGSITACISSFSPRQRSGLKRTERLSSARQAFSTFFAFYKHYIFLKPRLGASGIAGRSLSVFHAFSPPDMSWTEVKTGVL